MEEAVRPGNPDVFNFKTPDVYEERSLMKSLLKIGALVGILCAVTLYTNTQAFTQESLSPFNPDFLDYIHTQIQNTRLDADQEYTLGFIPPPVHLNHLKDTPLVHSELLQAGPPAYDLRTAGKVTPVRDQGRCGSCWSFATYASLESNLLPSEPWDFSESNLKNRSGFDRSPCDGGNFEMATAYLSRWEGPVNEKDDPYNPNSGSSPTGLDGRKHIQQVLIIPDRSTPYDNEKIKQAILDFGALATTLFQDNSYYDSRLASYYYPGYQPSNHAVAIVGWDDDYDRANFLITPPGDGAFIVKNSWGMGWGEEGYFYVSYYDSNIGKYNFVFNNAEEVANYSSIYQYDPLGWTMGLGFGSNTAWFANIFLAAASEQLSAVSFYAASPHSSYEIYVYTHSVNSPTSGLLEGSKTGVLSYAGYHTIPLGSPVSLIAGEKFSIVIKLTTPAYAYPVPLEYPIPGYSSRARAEAGQSFISIDGVNWKDLNSPSSSFQGSNACIKAFTLGPLYPGVTLLEPTGGEVIPSGSTATITWGAPPAAATFTLYYSINNGSTWRLIARHIPNAGDRTDISWAVPSPGGNKKNCRVLVVAYDASGKKLGSDLSDGPFKIEVVKVISPNGGEIFHAGDSHTIEWRASPEAYGFDVMLSSNNGTSWRTIATGVAGTRVATRIPPPSRGNRPNCRIKVIAYDAAGTTIGEDTSDALFATEVVKLTSPDASGPFTSGNAIAVGWTIYETLEDITEVQLLYWIHGASRWKPVTSPLWGQFGHPGNHTYLWEPPGDGARRNGPYRVKVVLKDARGITRGTDMSRHAFTIEPLPGNAHP